METGYNLTVPPMDTLPRVAWYKNGKPLNERRGSSLYLDWKYVLALRDVVPSDTGTYSCNVSNHLG